MRYEYIPSVFAKPVNKPSLSPRPRREGARAHFLRSFLYLYYRLLRRLVFFARLGRIPSIYRYPTAGSCECVILIRARAHVAEFFFFCYAMYLYMRRSPVQHMRRFRFRDFVYASIVLIKKIGEIAFDLANLKASTSRCASVKHCFFLSIRRKKIWQTRACRPVIFRVW